MFNVNLEPLISQIKEFNENQVKTNQLLTELLVVETNNEKHLSQIKELLTKK
jgi:hypothetical protein